MTSTAKVLVVLLVLAGIGVALHRVLRVADPTPPATVPRDDRPQAPADAAPAAASELPRATVTPRPSTDLEQGFLGRVVDRSGAPVAGAEVWLKEGVGSNLFLMMQMAQRGVLLPPIASGTTGAQGGFRLGMETADEAKAYEIAIHGQRWQPHKLPNLRLRPGEWYDLGTITLESGARLHGRVTIAGSNGLPVPKALVTLKTMGGFPELSPIP